jgi:hypothetical protein
MHSLIPENLDALLTREGVSAALTASGFPMKPKTLSTKASRGGGPPYRRFGQRALYRWGDALAWAQAKLSEPHHNTSESDLPPKSQDQAAATGVRRSAKVIAAGDVFDSNRERE